MSFPNTHIISIWMQTRSGLVIGKTGSSNAIQAYVDHK